MRMIKRQSGTVTGPAAGGPADQSLRTPRGQHGCSYRWPARRRRRPRSRSLIPSSMLVMHGAPGRLSVSSFETACSFPSAGASSGLACTHLGVIVVLVSRKNRLGDYCRLRTPGPTPLAGVFSVSSSAVTVNGPVKSVENICKFVAWKFMTGVFWALFRHFS